MSAIASKPMTAKEFAHRPEPADGSREELVRGEVVTMPVPGFRHGRISHIIGYRLERYLETKRIGTVTNEAGVHTENGPDTVRGPDVAFWSFERVPEGSDPELTPMFLPIYASKSGRLRTRP
jgi:Uma2 family endonuclease